MKHTLSTPLLLLALLLHIVSGCKKGESATITKSPGTFTAAFNGTNWEPVQYDATYFPKLQRLYITAEYRNQLLAGVQLDSLSPLRNYALESQGSQAAAEFVLDGVPYNSDQNVADAGGTFQLLKLDTVANKVSAVINFTGYSPERKRLVFASKTIADIELKRDTTSSEKNEANCTLSGVTTNNWKTAEVWGTVDCVSDYVHKTLRVEMPSVIGGFPARRHLLFHLPLDLKPGTYPVRPDLPPYFYCGNLDVTCRYILNDYNNAYYATSGSFTINSIDTAARKLTASFQVAVRDTSARRETIQISNGQLKLNYWYNR